jgi:hypothetical protein
MTAAEIRETYDRYLAALERLDKPPTVAVLTGVTNGVLLQATVEIAAQLAEMNEHPGLTYEQLAELNDIREIYQHVDAGPHQKSAVDIRRLLAFIDILRAKSL